MRSLTAPAIAALGGSVLSIVQLIYMQFPGSPLGLNSSNRDYDYDSVTYLGGAGLGSIAAVEDSAGEVKGLQLTMSGVPTDYIALALDDAGTVQGTPLVIRLGIMNANAQIVEAPIDWAGRLDTMSIVEDGETCSISVTAESTAVDLLRGAALTYSNVDQQALYTGDRAFEYVIAQANQRIVWPAKQWLLSSSGR